MSGTNKPSALSEKDANSALHTAGASADDNKNKATGRKSLDYHRQILQKKMETEKYGHHQATTTQNPTNTGASSEGTKKPAVKDAHLTSLLDADPAEHNRSGQYISPSDTIMSPCTAKLNAFKSRQAGKAKPKSLFAQHSAKKFDGDNVLGARSAATNPSDTKQSDANLSDTNP